MRRDGPPGVRSLIALGAGGVGIVVLLGLGACTSSGSATPSAAASGASAASTAPVSAGASTPPTGVPATTSAAASSLPVTDPSVLSTVPTRPVRTLPAVPLQSSAAFGDGVSARVVTVTHSTDHDRGPGAATGRPTVLFHLRLTNGSSKTVSVASVQVLAAYGTSGTPAIAATSATRAFSGSVRPGHSADAVYGFAVPSSGQGSVALTVTYTAGRPTVLLTGSAR